jgi:hypothetical protein
MTRVKLIFRSIWLGGFLLFLSSCETIVYWNDLPPPSIPRVVWVNGDTETIKRAVEVTEKLVAVKPLSASTVFVMTNELRFQSQKLPKIPEWAHSARCGVKGEQNHETLPPSSACIWIPTVYLVHLSDEGLAAILAHELGHVEKGHKSWGGAAEPKLIQWEADEAAAERLSLAGYYAGLVMRKSAFEFLSIDGSGWRHPWQTYPADCKPKSPQP